MIEIRKMNEQDIDEVVLVENDCFSVPWSKNSFIQELKNERARYLVATKNNKVVGYIGVWIILDEAHFTNVAVGSDFRGRKIGDKLVCEMINLCKNENVTSVTLEVRKSNIVAQNLYKKYGFNLAGIRKEYYSDNKEDALLMWKEF